MVEDRPIPKAESGKAIALSNLGKFHAGVDTLGKWVPERLTHQFALDPDKWEHTFYSLTLKEPKKIRYYRPKNVDILPGTLVGDMAIANQFYRTKDPVEQEKYALAYLASLKPYPVNLDDYKFPELLIPRKEQGVAEGLIDYAQRKLGLKWGKIGDVVNGSVVAEYLDSQDDSMDTDRYINSKFKLINITANEAEKYREISDLNGWPSDTPLEKVKGWGIDDYKMDRIRKNDVTYQSLMKHTPVVSSRGFIINGNHRVARALEMGIDPIPILKELPQGVAEGPLNELFDGGKDWKWTYQDKNQAEAKFTVGDVNYTFSAGQDPDEAPGDWDVEFAATQPLTSPSWGLTGTGNSAQVFGTVVEIMKSFITNKKASIRRMTFAAKEDSRQGLYARMIKRLLPKWNLEQSGEAFVLTRPGGLVFWVYSVEAPYNKIPAVKVKANTAKEAEQIVLTTMPKFKGADLMGMGASKNKPNLQGVAEGSLEGVNTQTVSSDYVVHYVADQNDRDDPYEGDVPERINQFSGFKRMAFPIKKLKLHGYRFSPDLAKEYSTMSATTSPPIVVEPNGEIIDGYHRAQAAVMRKDQTIDAFVGINTENVNKQGVAEGGEKYKVKSIGTDKDGDYYISPSTGKKVYKSGVKRGDHENPNTGEIKKNIAEAPGDFGLGANYRSIPDDEMQDFMDRSKTKKKTKRDKFDYPYVHGSNIEVKNEAGKKYNTEALKSAIMQRPKSILGQNAKMQHSETGTEAVYDIGLPALKGLAVNENTGEFVVVDTCPGAGACKTYCYAMKGSYVMFKAVSLGLSRMLNFLLNDPEGFAAKLNDEIAEAKLKNAKKGAKTVVRWHDAGDFFSEQYLDMAYAVANANPGVSFYAYTKMGDVANASRPKNFNMNFSQGASSEQEKKVDIVRTKHSKVVPKDMFFDLIDRDGNNLNKDSKGRMQFASPEKRKEFKIRLAHKYTIDPTTILTYDEMMQLPIGSKPKWNVIVMPGDGDNSANRNDVVGSYLLFH